MKHIELQINIDSNFFGNDMFKTEGFAFNLNKNIEKIFNVRSDYTLKPVGNSYVVRCQETPRIELEISEYIEKNWFNVKKK
jgi:hypothetical protein